MRQTRGLAATWHNVTPFCGPFPSTSRDQICSSSGTMCHWCAVDSQVGPRHITLVLLFWKNTHIYHSVVSFDRRKSPLFWVSARFQDLVPLFRPRTWPATGSASHAHPLISFVYLRTFGLFHATNLLIVDAAQGILADTLVL